MRNKAEIEAKLEQRVEMRELDTFFDDDELNQLIGQISALTWVLDDEKDN